MKPKHSSYYLGHDFMIDEFIIWRMLQEKGTTTVFHDIKEAFYYVQDHPEHSTDLIAIGGYKGMVYFGVVSALHSYGSTVAMLANMPQQSVFVTTVPFKQLNPYLRSPEF